MRCKRQFIAKKTQAITRQLTIKWLRESLSLSHFLIFIFIYDKAEKADKTLYSASKPIDFVRITEREFIRTLILVLFADLAE